MCGESPEIVIHFLKKGGERLNKNKVSDSPSPRLILRAIRPDEGAT